MALTTATVQLNVAAAQAATPTAGTATASLASTFSTAVAATLASGAGLCDRGWWSTRTLSASASETIDFAGTLTDPFGTTISFARIKILVIAADSGNTNNVVVGANSSTITTLFGATTHTTTVRPGGALMWMTGTADSTGYVITASSADLLGIANSSSGTSVTYTIIALGVST